jgi:hypothetical protein
MPAPFLWRSAARGLPRRERQALFVRLLIHVNKTKVHKWPIGKTGAGASAREAPNPPIDARAGSRADLQTFQERAAGARDLRPRGLAPARIA